MQGPTIFHKRQSIRSSNMSDTLMKHVSFGPSVHTLIVERIENAWYTRSELAVVWRRDHELLKKIKRSEFREGAYDSARGLPRNIGSLPTMRVVEAVLQEQRKQREAGIVDVLQIANVSRNYSKKDRILAAEVGLNDEIEALEQRSHYVARVSSIRWKDDSESTLLLLPKGTEKQSRRLMFQNEHKNRAIKETNSYVAQLSAHRQNKKAPSLKAVFAKTLRECKLGDDNQASMQRRYVAEGRRMLTAQQALSITYFKTLRNMSDRDDMTELTTSSCLSIEST